MKVIQLFKSESQLIKRAARNDREAQQRLFELHSGKMLSICRQYVKDLQHAEEVMLNGFFKIFKNLSAFRNEGSFEGWMRRIMIREAISFLRVQHTLEYPEEDLEKAGSYCDPVNLQSDVSYIQELIDRLPAGYKMVFVLFAIEGYKHSEIAKMLNISQGTSKSQLSKARKLLQQQLDEENNTGYGTH